MYSYTKYLQQNRVHVPQLSQVAWLLPDNRGWWRIANSTGKPGQASLGRGHMSKCENRGTKTLEDNLTAVASHKFSMGKLQVQPWEGSQAEL